MSRANDWVRTVTIRLKTDIGHVSLLASHGLEQYIKLKLYMLSDDKPAASFLEWVTAHKRETT